jgi:pyruvate formate lyase activating enzyme
MRFKPYYGTDGGVTFSGGEPLLQKEFLTEVLALCKSRGIHTCLDTAGAGCGGYGEILKNTDLVLLDVKHYTPEGYKAITGQSMDAYAEFLETVQSMEIPLWIRHVVVPGLTDGEDHLAGLAEYIKGIRNVKRVELLPYHVLGVPKYHAMGIPYPLEGVPPMDAGETARWQELMGRSLEDR